MATNLTTWQIDKAIYHMQNNDNLYEPDVFDHLTVNINLSLHFDSLHSRSKAI